MDNKNATPRSQQLPVEVLSFYNLKEQKISNLNGEWLVENGNGKFVIREFFGEPARLKVCLKWQRYLCSQQKDLVVEIIPAVDNADFLEVNGRLFYAVSRVKESKYQPAKREHLLSTVRKIGLIHRLSKGYQVETINQTGILWPRVIQQRLVDLLSIKHLLREKRDKTDFERIFLEHFLFFYDQGQQSLQKMVLAGYDAKLQENRRILINSFSPQRLGLVDGDVIFFSLENWAGGQEMMDLALFINSYLPLYKWEEDLMKQIVKEYEQNEPLDQQDKYILLAILRFPYRFWFYAAQYIKHTTVIQDLVVKLKRYIYESYWRDKCLDSMEEWLWR